MSSPLGFLLQLCVLSFRESVMLTLQIFLQFWDSVSMLILPAVWPMCLFCFTNQNPCYIQCYCYNFLWYIFQILVLFPPLCMLFLEAQWILQQDLFLLLPQCWDPCSQRKCLPMNNLHRGGAKLESEICTKENYKNSTRYSMCSDL